MTILSCAAAAFFVVAFLIAPAGAEEAAAPKVPAGFLDTRAKADAGDAAAQYAMAVYYSNAGLEAGEGDDGIADDYIQAVIWLRRAADENHIPALLRLAALYDHHVWPRTPEAAYGFFRNTNPLRKNIDEAKRLYSRAITLGDAAAAFKKAVLTPDRAEKKQLLELAYERGYARSVMELAGIALGPEYSEENARRIFTMASAMVEREAGNSESLILFGAEPAGLRIIMLAEGIGTARDEAKALALTQELIDAAMKEVKADGSQAMLPEDLIWLNYGIACMGLCDDKNAKDSPFTRAHMEQAGHRWLMRAVYKGSARAQGYLGDAYENGKAVPKDMVEAYAWRNVAAARGDEQSRRARDRLEKDMTAEQKAQAQVLSRDYHERYVRPFAGAQTEGTP